MPPVAVEPLAPVASPPARPRPSLLFVATRFPYPPHGGDRLRVFRLLSELAKRHDVTLAVISNDRDPPVELLRAESGVQQIAVFRQSPLEPLAGAALSLVRGEPLQLGFFRSRRLADWLRGQQGRHDLGIFHLLRGAQYARGFGRSRRVLEMCDAVSEVFRQNTLITRWYQPWHWVSRIEAGRALAYERHCMREFDLVTLHTRHDARVVSPTMERVLVSTQGVDTALYPFTPPSRRAGRRLAFIGKMDYHPNLDAMQWFIEHVLPRLPADVGVKVVGVCPPAVAERLAADTRVVVTGRVDSIAEATADCAIGIAPIRAAAGVQNKVLEYLALGLPVVTTNNVLKGLLPGAERCMRIAETEADWQQAIESLLAAPAEALALEGRAYVEARHDWAQIGREYSAALERLPAHQPTAP